MMKSPIDILLDDVEWKPLEWEGLTGDGLPYATHEGVLRIGEREITCYTLNTGERILDADAVARFFGMRDQEELARVALELAEKLRGQAGLRLGSEGG